MLELKGGFTSAKIMIDQVEEQCIKQIYSMLNHPAFTEPIAIMPDTHAGKGSVIGFTMPLTNMVIPNLVGVDIGCGMLGMNIGKFELPDFKVVDDMIRDRVPMGFKVNQSKKISLYDEIDKTFRESATMVYRAAKDKLGWNYDLPDFDIPPAKRFEMICKRVGIDKSRAELSLGSLGGGNHFIEIGIDQNEEIWITIHTGSRGFGLAIAKYWQKMASESMVASKGEVRECIEEAKKMYSGKRLGAEIGKIKEEMSAKRKGAPRDQEWLEGENAWGYILDMIYAQIYAVHNRAIIASSIIGGLGLDDSAAKKIEIIETTHNYINFNDMIIRKGAISSYEGEKMIIPFNPRDGLLICEGKSNEEWNFSAPHGAGRLMSRSQAKAEIDDDLAECAMEGVWASVKPKDESPLAYKDPKVIESCIEPTAKIINRVRPLLNIKAGD